MVDDHVLRKVESALEVAKFAPKKDEAPTVDILLDQAEADLKEALQRIQQMREAWNDIAQHMSASIRRINK